MNNSHSWAYLQFAVCSQQVAVVLCGENASWAAGELFCFNTKSDHRAKFGNKAESLYPGTHPTHSLV